MKNIKKLLALFLAVVTIFTVFGISASAVSSSSTAKEMLNYYENCLKTTSAKGTIKVNNNWKYKLSADYSTLSEKDRTETEKIDAGIFDDTWYEENFSFYYLGDSDSESVAGVDTDTITVFSIKNYMSNFDAMKLKSAKLTTASNGDNTIVFNLTENSADGSSVKMTITTVTSKKGLLKSYTAKGETKFYNTSAQGKNYLVTESTVDVFKITYKKVSVKSISLSDTEVTLGFNESYDITVTVTPENATFKDVYCVIEGYDIDNFEDDVPVYYAVNDDGTITLTAANHGTCVLEVYSYDGDKLATCDVTVKYNFFQRILAAFIEFFGMVFGVAF